MKFLIIGFGSIGRRHAGNLKELGITCIVVEPNLARLKEASRFGYESYKVLDEIPSNCKFSAVLVCSPTAFHVDQAIWALESGSKVFIEKPVGLSYNESFKLTKYDQNKIFIGYSYQWNPQYLQLKKLLKQNLIGKPFNANFVIGMHLEDWHPWEDYRNFFMSSKKLGGGALLDESHFIQLALDLFGYPNKVSGIISKISNLDIDSDDYVSSQLIYENLLVDIKLDLFKRPHESYLQLYGTNGSIICDLIKKNNCITSYNSYSKSDSKNYSFTYERNEVFKEMMKDFINFVQGDKYFNHIGIKDGLAVMALIDKIRIASVKQGWEVTNGFSK
jgi:predicted dehydrogenase